MIIDDFDGCKLIDIMAMSHEELQAAVIRVFSIVGYESESFYGDVYLSDHIADAFRGRQ